ncbi:hypothetical protein OIO90_002597 [Microbotryomycetes sp. JL221]|nr:hypothetical protein OIO90_002597 [Microbotryomycetes sp. JL221]
MSDAPKFSASAYLRGLGWKGPGTGLTSAPHARSKPVLVAQKKSLSGVGKDRDESFAWWDAVFSNVANKVSTGSKVEHNRTITGIISPRNPSTATSSRAQTPPAFSSSSSSSLLNPTTTSQGSGGLNQDAMGQAKVELARRTLYTTFLRGQPMGPTLKVEQTLPSSRSSVNGHDVKGKGKAMSNDQDEHETAGGISDARREAKRIRKSIREARRARKAQTKAASASSANFDTSETHCSSSLENENRLPRPSSTDDKHDEKQSRKKKRKRDQDGHDLKADEKVKKKIKKEKKTGVDVAREAENTMTKAETETTELNKRAAAKAARKEEKRMRKAIEKALRES